MGMYLSEPITLKKIEKGKSKEYEFCSAKMQGWRINMEDSTISKLESENNIQIFGVFDGHKG